MIAKSEYHSINIIPEVEDTEFGIAAPEALSNKVASVQEIVVQLFTVKKSDSF